MAVPWTALAPWLVLGTGALVVLLLVSLRRSHASAWWASLVALGGAFSTLPMASASAPAGATELLVIDHYSLFFLGVLVFATFGIVLIARAYLERLDTNREEFYVVLLLGTLGASVLAASRHFFSFFLGLELLSVSLYLLIAYPRRRPEALEAGLKYLVLAASASAILLFGMALVYSDLGSMGLPALSRAFAGEQPGPLVMVGLALVVTGVGFKLAVAPFHLWVPDVYQGAPAPVSAFIATVSKGGVLALWLRYFIGMEGYRNQVLFTTMAAIAIVSMVVGNFLALRQENVKRLLAYSSIAHLGYLLVALLVGGRMGIEAAGFYLVSYVLATLGAFGVIAVVSGATGDLDRIEDYRGLFWRRPALAATMTVMLLSLAGIPLTAGFVGKLYLLLAGVEMGLWVLVLTLVTTSVVGLFYYLRVIVALVADAGGGEGVVPTVSRPARAGAAIALIAVVGLSIGFGVYPESLIGLVERASMLPEAAVELARSP